MTYSFQHTLPHSLTFMFKDDDWFWKVSIGALAVMLIPLGVGYFFVIGYCAETVNRCRSGNGTLPEWNRLGMLWMNGAFIGAALIVYSVCGVAVLGAASGTINALTVLSGVVIIHAFVGPFVIIRYLDRPLPGSCFKVRSIVSLMASGGRRAFALTGSAFAVFAIVLCFGWMALMIGWPFFIFWGALVSASFTAAIVPGTTEPETAQ